LMSDIHKLKRVNIGMSDIKNRNFLFFHFYFLLSHVLPHFSQTTRLRQDFHRRQGFGGQVGMALLF